jgi:hypothetical protein
MALAAVLAQGYWQLEERFVISPNNKHRSPSLESQILLTCYKMKIGTISLVVLMLMVVLIYF